jgi:hypothetical protein
MQSAFRLALVSWAGSLWSTVWVALTIFHSQPDRHLSGMLAARLFSIETYLGVAVALFAWARGAAARVQAARLAAPRMHAARLAAPPFRFGFVAVALLLFNEWVLKAIMDQALARGSALGLGFGPWHGVSALVYLAACLAAVVAVCEYEI